MASYGYIAGDHWVICDECGFKVRSSQTRLRWDNRLVCLKDWEPRHPQEFVRGRKDKQRVSNPRPEPADVFLELNQVTEDNIEGLPVDRVLEPAAASITYTTAAPTIPIFVASGSITYTGQVPFVVVDDILRPAAASIEYSTAAPSVVIGINVSSASASIEYTTAAPYVFVDQVPKPAAASIEYTTAAPTIVVDQIISPEAEAITYATAAPVAVIDQIVRPIAASIEYSTAAPNVVASITVTPAAASITYTGQTPTILNGDIMVDGSSNQYVDESGNSYGIV